MGNTVKKRMGLQKPPFHKTLKSQPITKPKNDENAGSDCDCDCFITSITSNLHINPPSNIIRPISSDSTYHSWLVIFSFTYLFIWLNMYV